ncbi:hypothetical protein FQN54_009093 [Arachnomyces sp. PD_36]|nr:hypothetical protein FQN54_009093 [Arachnomyces sp. PD_36]
MSANQDQRNGPLADASNPSRSKKSSINGAAEGTADSDIKARSGSTPASVEDGKVAGKKRKASSNPSRGVANLTPEQLSKKRANDREAQRAIRERTKAQIEALERRVVELTSQQPFQDLQAALKQTQAIQAENEEIKRRLSSVISIIQPILGNQTGSDPPAASSRPANDIPASRPSAPSDQSLHTAVSRESATGPSFSQSPASAGPPSPGVQNPTRNGIQQVWQNHNALTLDTDQQLWSSNSTTAPSASGALQYQTHKLNNGLEFAGPGERLGLRFLLDGSQQVPKANGPRWSPEMSSQSHGNVPIRYPQARSQFENAVGDPSTAPYSMPVRNISPTCPLDSILLDFLEGRQREAAEGASSQKLVGPPYPSVSSLLNPGKSMYSHPLSKVFIDILGTFPDISALPEQVAVLYVMFLMMRWQIYPTLENYERLPEWLCPRASQLITPHPAWMDYLVFPRMRDRVIANYPDYPFENWFIPWTRTLCVNWPYEPTDALLESADSDEVTINPVFERHIRNINNWSVGPAFAEAFPSLVGSMRVKPDTKLSAGTTSM